MTNQLISNSFKEYKLYSKKMMSLESENKLSNKNKLSNHPQSKNFLPQKPTSKTNKTIISPINKIQSQF
jgi:hypothetical protein